MKTFNNQFFDVPTTIDAAGNVSYGTGSQASSAHNSRNNSRNNSSDTGPHLSGGTVGLGVGVGGAGLVEASLYNEFKESPAAMKTINLHSDATKEKGRSQTSRPPAGTAATGAFVTSPGASNWMSGITNAFSSFTSSYGHATEAPARKQSDGQDARTSRHISSDKTDARTQFKPKEQRPKLTQDEVNRRLSEYHNVKNTTPVKSGAISTATCTTSHQPQEAGENGLAEEDWAHVGEGRGLTLLSPQSQAASLIALSPVVLYYCSCLISKSPGM